MGHRLILESLVLEADIHTYVYIHMYSQAHTHCLSPVIVTTYEHFKPYDIFLNVIIYGFHKCSSHTHARKHACKHARTQAHTHTRTHTHTHTHTHTNTHTPLVLYLLQVFLKVTDTNVLDKAEALDRLTDSMSLF